MPPLKVESIEEFRARLDQQYGMVVSVALNESGAPVDPQGVYYLTAVLLAEANGVPLNPELASEIEAYLGSPEANDNPLATQNTGH